MRRIAFTVVLLTVAGCSTPPTPTKVPRSAPPADEFELRERQIIAGVSAIRTNPSDYAVYIEERLPYYRGAELREPGKLAIRTTEGAAAAREAIEALRRAAPVPPVELAEPLMLSSRLHARDIGPKGMLSHEGSSGETLSDRVRRYAASYDVIGENISFGPEQPRNVVMDLVIDDNVRDRGHRRILLDGRFRNIGVSCWTHSVYRTVCVLDFAGKLMEKAGVNGIGRAPMPAVATPR